MKSKVVMPRRKPADSSNIQSSTWRNNVFYVKFLNSPDIYCYNGVPQGIFRQYEKAPSKGEYFAKWIGGHYDFTIHKKRR